MKLEIHYSIINCGDGSAAVQLCTTALVADLHQELMVNSNEGWAEECTGSITVESDSPITVTSGIMDAAELISELNEELTESWMNLNKNDVKDAIKKLKATL